MKGIASHKLWAFIGLHVVLAILINSYCRDFSRSFAPVPDRAEHRAEYRPHIPAPEPLPDPVELARKAKQEAERQRQLYLAQYLNEGIPKRKAGANTFAIVAASENGSLDFKLATAFAERLKQGTTEIRSSLFKPPFIGHGLFDRSWNDPAEVFRLLELTNWVDGVLFARTRLHYSTNKDLENVITAAMQMDVFLAPVIEPITSQSFTFSASGAGFNLMAAKSMAEERLLKQIASHTGIAIPR